MSGRGLHIALTNEEFRFLEGLSSEQQVEHIANVLEEEKFHSDDACQTDKSWSYIHAALTGTDPDAAMQLPESRFKLARSENLLGRLLGQKATVRVPAGAKNAIMGRDVLLISEDYYIGVVPAEEVAEVSSELESISNDDLGRRVRQVHARYHASGTAEEAVDYATGWYSDLVSFYSRAAVARKHVIFTVDF